MTRFSEVSAPNEKQQRSSAKNTNMRDEHEQYMVEFWEQEGRQHLHVRDD